MISIPKPLEEQSRIYDLKKRLDWGKAALTIIDVRNRDTFNKSHITGSVSLPLNQLLNGVLSNFEPDRDIYFYGQTDEETTVAANTLRDVGYVNVAELLGGLPAWKAAGFPIEGKS